MPWKKLHPTLKACHCGFVGKKADFLRHMDSLMASYDSPVDFFAEHGEIPLNEDGYSPSGRKFCEPYEQAEKKQKDEMEFDESLWQ